MTTRWVGGDLKFRKCLSSPDVTLSYAFKSMTPVQQLTYHDLGNFADDDGFVDNPTVAMMMNGADGADLSELTSRGYLVAFEDGVVLINHWKVSNSIRKDRYRPSLYHARLAGMNMEPGLPYRPDLFTEVGHLPAVTTNCQPDDNQMATNCQPLVTPKTRQVQDKYKTEKEKVKRKSRPRFVPPTPGEVRAYCADKGYSVDADAFVDFYESKGWVVGRSPMRSWQAACRTWAARSPKAAPAWHGATFDCEEVVSGGDAG